MFFCMILKARKKMCKMKSRLSVTHLLLGIKDLNIHCAAERSGTTGLNFDLNIK